MISKQCADRFTPLYATWTQHKPQNTERVHTDIWTKTMNRLTMISKSGGHASLISLENFHQPYPARIRVNCLDESIALGFEEGNI